MKKHHIIIAVIVLLASAALVGFFALQNREQVEDIPGFEYVPDAAGAVAE